MDPTKEAVKPEEIKEKEPEKAFEKQKEEKVEEKVEEKPQEKPQEEKKENSILAALTKPAESNQENLLTKLKNANESDTEFTAVEREPSESSFKKKPEPIRDEETLKENEALKKQVKVLQDRQRRLERDLKEEKDVSRTFGKKIQELQEQVKEAPKQPSDPVTVFLVFIVFELLIAAILIFADKNQSFYKGICSLA